MSPLLEINNLSIDFLSESGNTRAVDGISLRLGRGETLGIVGESGSGKSVTALSVMRLLPAPPAHIRTGQILYYADQTPVDLLQLPDKDMQHIRGADIAMIFQEPMTSLNPVFRCGHQVTEALQLHRKMDFQTARAATLELFDRVKLPEPARIFEAYPHQISGGQKQRVMIAMAMSCNPNLMIADEPTTALDVTVQKAILDLMRELREASGLSMLFISHDLGVISEICDRVAVMFRGKIVEEGTAQEILQHPQHPYTRGLVACRPSLHRRLRRLPTVPDFLENTGFEARVVTPAETTARAEALYAEAPLLEVKNLQVRFPKKKNWLGQPTEWLNAVDQVSFEVYPGETFGLAGESGCGKTTLGRSIARLTTAQNGTVLYKGVDLQQLTPEALLPFRREIQVVFQDPYSSLNPRMSIGDAIMEPMQVHELHESNRIRRQKTIELLETVGLQADHFQRYPHEFSGGQRQRICVARALALEPRLLICDEMVSALDVSVQATVLNLLLELREKLGLTYLFISHDLSVIKQMCDRVLIMNRGKIEELGFPDAVYQNPEKEYVRRLIEAIPGGY
ncbi:MAG: ABC transporter ATP-binding protein [Bacteroidetes bacterium]|nr:ABC transporter ATP-binding protein [Bacteroidota bacterium]